MKNASQPLPVNHVVPGSSHCWPSCKPQLTVTEAKAPSLRCSGRDVNTISDTESPLRPLSRNAYSLSGETMNGGLQEIRSNRSPATGSKKFPSRHSTFVTPFSWALKLVSQSARGRTLVATTRRACRANSKA